MKQTVQAWREKRVEFGTLKALLEELGFVITATLGRLRQEDHKFENSLVFTSGSHLRNSRQGRLWVRLS